MALFPVVALIVALIMSAFTMWHQIELYDDVSYIDFAIEKLQVRVFGSVVDVVHFLFTNIPTKYEYFLGDAYWMNIRAALSPGEYLGFGGWVNQVAFDMGGGATVPAVAEFYANFGVLGSCVGMFLLGFIINSIYIKMLKNLARAKDTKNLLVITFLGMGMLSFAVNSIFGYLIYLCLPITACLVFMIKINWKKVFN